MSREELLKHIREKPVKYAENPFWDYINEEIIDKRTQKALDMSTYFGIFDTIRLYFKNVYTSFNTEAQVLIVDESAYKTLYDQEQRIPYINVGNNLYALVLPQENTWANTSISETYWQSRIVDNQITPLMRIHSHHILDAYQSATDWSSLNSGTLEVVIGDVLNEDYKLAYWLDQRGKTTKNHYFKRTRNNGNVSKHYQNLDKRHGL